MSDKVKRIPIPYRQRDINQHDFGYVPCELTGRYLQFESTYCEDNNLVFVDVMTTSEGTIVCSGRWSVTSPFSGSNPLNLATSSPKR